MYRFGLALACFAALTGSARAASPDPADLVPTPEVQVKTRNLVKQLGSYEYAEREDAQTQLAKLGRLARPALLVGVNTNPDPEVRRRCAELLPTATALDIRAKLDTFLADTDGKYEHDLPAWNTFRTVIGSRWTFFGQSIWTDRQLDRAAREVFAELAAVHANGRLLRTVDGSRTELTELVVAQRQDLYARRYPRREDDSPREVTLEEVTALLFADGRVGSQYMLRRGSISSLLTASGFTRAARGTEPKARVYRAIAVAWLNSRNEPREMTQAVTIAANLDLPDQACEIAVRLLTMPGVTAMSRSRAVSGLIENGNKKHVPLLAGALNTTTVVGSVPNPTGTGTDSTGFDIQLRDVALAVSILLSEQKLADYDLIDRYAESTGYEPRLYVANRYYFRDDEARTRAFSKWNEWRKAHPSE